MTTIQKQHKPFVPRTTIPEFFEYLTTECA
jgi:hypothetical protein